MSIDNISTNIEQQKTLTKQLEFLKLPGLSESSYNSFIKSIENEKGNDNYNKIIESLLDIDNREDIIDYINENNGFPINTPSNLAFNIFIKDYFDIDIRDEQEKRGNEQEKRGNEQEKKYKILAPEFLKENTNSLLKIINKKEDGYEIIEEFKNVLEKGTYQESQDFFNNNSEKLFYQIAKSGDKEFFDKTYSFVHDNFGIIVHDFNFYTQGDKWEETPNLLSGQEKIIKGVEKENDGILSIDLSHIPAKSSLSLLDSNYRFDKKLDSKKVNGALDEYLNSEGLANEGMKNINGFSSLFGKILGKINGITSIEDGPELLKNIVESGKINLLSYMSKIKGVPEEFKITEQDIKKFGTSNSKEDYVLNLNIIQNKIKKIRNFISNIAILAYKKYEDKVRGIVEMDKGEQENQVKTLNFIHSIGFDMIPQSDTTNLINQVNSGANRSEIDLGEGFRLNTDINLEEGVLGFSDSIDGTSTKEKEVFIRFFNKMLSGDPLKPVNPTQVLMNNRFQVSDTLIQDYRAKLYKGGVFNINKALSNLKKPNN